MSTVTADPSVYVGWAIVMWLNPVAVVIWVEPVMVVVAAANLMLSATAEAPEAMVLAGVKIFWLVKVWAVPNPATVSDAAGKVMVVASVPARVMELLTVRVLPSMMVKVDPVAGVVRVTLLMVVAVATPKVGVTKVGEVENTRLVEVVPVAPDAVYPVMLLKAVIPADEALVPPLATGSTPVTPLVRGNPVALVRTKVDGVPRLGVVKTGEVAKTANPVPVSSEREVAS